MPSVVGSLLLPAALAAGAAGNGTPVLGGGVAGPLEDGAAGLFTNPASAHPAEGELLFDLQYVYTAVSMQLSGEDEEGDAGGSVIPALAVAAPPLGPIGLGLALHVPYGRGGENPEDSSLRFHNQSGEIRAMEAAFNLALAPTEWLTVGAAGRVAQLSLVTVNATDTGAMLAGMLEEGGEELLGDPFLEGTQSVQGQGPAGGWAIGARVAPDNGWVFAADFRSKLRGVVEGDLSYVLSNQLAVEITGTQETYFEFPAELALGAAIPAGRFTISPELTWIGWSSWDRIETRLHDLTFGSRDPVLDAYIEALGGSLDQLVADMDSNVTTNGTEDIISGGVGVKAQVSDAVDLLGGLHLTPAATQDDHLHPGNADFAVADFRVGVVYWTRKRTRLAFTADRMFSPDRSTSQSVYDPLAAKETGLAYPSGNGTYTLAIWRAGLTLIQPFGQAR